MKEDAILRGLHAVLGGTLHVDIAQHGASDKERYGAFDILTLLIPVITGYGTDQDFHVAVIAQ